MRVDDLNRAQNHDGHKARPPNARHFAWYRTTRVRWPQRATALAPSAVACLLSGQGDPGKKFTSRPSNRSDFVLGILLPGQTDISAEDQKHSDTCPKCQAVLVAFKNSRTVRSMSEPEAEQRRPKNRRPVCAHLDEEIKCRRHHNNQNHTDRDGCCWRQVAVALDR